MKNKKKTMLALIAAVLLVAAAIIAAILILRSREKAPSSQPVSVYSILAADTSAIKSIAVHNSAGEDYRIVLDGSFPGTIEGVSSEVDLDSMTLGLFVSRYTAINSYHEPIALSDSSSMAMYGLDSPHGYVVLEQTDGSRTKILIGDQTVKKNGYYLYVDGTNEVHIVENTYRDYLDYQSDSFISKQLAAVDQESSFTITQLSIRNRERDEAITVQMRFGQYTDNSIYMYEVVEPEYYSADDNKIFENVFTYLNPLKGTGIYSMDVSPENLDTLGLAEPQYTLSFINAGIEYVFHFAKLDNGTVVGMKDGGKVVLEMEPSILQMLNIQVADVANAFVLLQSVDEVQHYIVNTNGTAYDFTLSADENGLSAVSYQQRQIDVEAFRELYSLGLNIKIVGDVESGETGGAPVLNLTYRCADGSENRVDFYEIDGRYCHVTLNGNGRFKVRLSDIEKFAECLRTLTQQAVSG